MSNTELLTAISDMLEQKLEQKLEEKLEQKLEEKLEQKLEQKLDQKLEPIILRLDKIEDTIDNEVLPRIGNLETRIGNLENKVDALENKMDALENKVDALENKVDALENKMDALENKMDALENKMEQDVIPRLGHIEECYIDTYERYQKGIDQLDKMQMDIDIIKITVTGHSEQLQSYTGPYLVK